MNTTKTIMIKGVANTGKTTICKLVREHFQHLKAKFKYISTNNANDENKAVLIKYNDINILISPSGDNGTEIDKHRTYYGKVVSDCDIAIDYFIFTTRTKGETFEKAQRLANDISENNFVTIETNKLSSLDTENINNECLNIRDIIINEILLEVM